MTSGSVGVGTGLPSPVVDTDHAPSGEVAWREAHRLDAVFPGVALALTLMITAHPGRGHAEFHGVVLRLDADPVVVAEFDVPLPRHGWEIRASGLWADHVRETPMDHWSYGLEAFGLAVDDPEELLGGAVGRREPLGWELEFEARAPARYATDQRYGQAGSVHGLILDPSGSIEVDGYGVRSHWWGTSTPTSIGLGDEPSGRPLLVYPTIDGRWSVVLDRSGMVSTFDPAPAGGAQTPASIG